MQTLNFIGRGKYYTPQKKFCTTYSYFFVF